MEAGYNAGVYKDAVDVTWNQKNTDYKIKTVKADYTVTKASVGTLKVSSSGYTGVYDGQLHGITVKAEPFRADENITVYYSTKAELTESNFNSSDSTAGSSTVNPTFKNAGTYKVYYSTFPANISK